MSEYEMETALSLDGHVSFPDFLLWDHRYRELLHFDNPNHKDL